MENNKKEEIPTQEPPTTIPKPFLPDTMDPKDNSVTGTIENVIVTGDASGKPWMKITWNNKSPLVLFEDHYLITLYRSLSTTKKTISFVPASHTSKFLVRNGNNFILLGNINTSKLTWGKTPSDINLIQDKMFKVNNQDFLTFEPLPNLEESKEEKEKKEKEAKEKKEKEEKEKKEKEEKEKKEGKEKDKHVETKSKEDSKNKKKNFKVKTCRFFNSKKGCNKGSQCTYKHVPKPKSNNFQKKVSEEEKKKESKEKNKHVETKSNEDFKNKRVNSKDSTCRFFNSKYGCNKGSQCAYKHGSKPKSNNFKKVKKGVKITQEECKYFKSDGKCKFGNRCRYAHTPKKSPAPKQREGEKQKLGGSTSARKVCNKHLKNKCKKGSECTHIHDTSNIPCKFGNNCKANGCKFEHQPWKYQNNCLCIAFHNEVQKLINMKIADLISKFHTNYYIPISYSKYKSVPEFTYVLIPLSCDNTAVAAKNYFDTVIENNSKKDNKCFIISRTEFLENADINEKKPLPTELKDSFNIFVRKNGTNRKNLTTAIEKLHKFDHFLKVIENVKSGKDKSWVKVQFSKMTPQIAAIFYNPKVQTRKKHPLFHNCHIKLENYNTKCSKCGMIGHEVVHCSEGLEDIVLEEGPYLHSKHTAVKDAKPYNPKVIKTTCTNHNQNDTFHVTWKTSNNPPQKPTINPPKKTLNFVDHKSSILAIRKTADVDEACHLNNFINLIKTNNTLLTYGAARWEELYDQFHDSEKGNSLNLNQNNLDVCNLEIYNLIKSATSNLKDFNSKDNTITWITCVFILQHSKVLYERHLKQDKRRIEKCETLKKEIEKEKNSKERDRKASLLFGALNLSFKEATIKLCLNFGFAKADQSLSTDNSINTNESSNQIEENKPPRQN